MPFLERGITTQQCIGESDSPTTQAMQEGTCLDAVVNYYQPAGQCSAFDWTDAAAALQLDPGVLAERSSPSLADVAPAALDAWQRAHQACRI